MSLRLRLTVLYTAVMGGVLLLFGLVVYSLVSLALLNQLDDLLARTANDIILVSRVDSTGEIDLRTLPPFELSESVFVQLWDTNNRLRASSPTIARLDQPLDPIAYRSAQPVFTDAVIGKAHLRALTVPLMVDDRPVAILQVATSRLLVDSTQGTLLVVLGITALAAMSLVGWLSWLLTGRALSRLEMVTEAAAQITRADDLSRRIPEDTEARDEIGTLIRAFNATLSRLEKLFTSQRRFIADVSHELRTPLTVIKGNVGLMRKMQEADEESLSGIEMEVDRLTRMVGDLLLLAQAESGKLPLDMQNVELDTVVLEVYHQMSVLAGDRIQVKLSQIDQVQVFGDRDRLKQVMLNLVGNAIQYTPAGGIVTLSLDRAGDQARFIVADTGPGIAPQDLPHIFERFYRGEKSRTRMRDGSGYGLGLSIASWIVKNHGGKIEASSVEGKGSTFCVWLPMKSDTMGRFSRD